MLKAFSTLPTGELWALQVKVRSITIIGINSIMDKFGGPDQNAEWATSGPRAGVCPGLI